MNVPFVTFQYRVLKVFRAVYLQAVYLGKSQCFFSVFLFFRKIVLDLNKKNKKKHVFLCFFVFFLFFREKKQETIFLCFFFFFYKNRSRPEQKNVPHPGSPHFIIRTTSSCLDLISSLCCALRTNYQ